MASVDIEECVQSKRLHHSNEYHSVSDEERLDIQCDLLKWYQLEKRTNMPWRKPTNKDCDIEVCFYIYVFDLYLNIHIYIYRHWLRELMRVCCVHIYTYAYTCILIQIHIVWVSEIMLQQVPTIL